MLSEERLLEIARATGLRGEMHGTSPTYARALLGKFVAAVNAEQLDPERDVTQLIADGFAQHGYRQGTKECVAFFRGAMYAKARIDGLSVPVDQTKEKP